MLGCNDPTPKSGIAPKKSVGLYTWTTIKLSYGGYSLSSHTHINKKDSRLLGQGQLLILGIGGGTCQ